MLPISFILIPLVFFSMHNIKKQAIPWTIAIQINTSIWGINIPYGKEYKAFETLNFGWVFIRDPFTKKIESIRKV